jgi:hypothetical protein
MPVLESLVGRVFGRLTVLARGTKRPGVFWLCACSCGSQFVASAGALKCGDTRSCGCLLRENGVAQGLANRRHGESGKTVEYKVWKNMKDRCYNPCNRQYKDYGGRGIEVCSRWLTFEAFLEDMERRPPGGYTLDRIDNNKGYAPANCRWATRLTQNVNRRTTVWIEHAGITRHLAGWARVLGIDPETLRYRLAHWPKDRALSLASSTSAP